MDLFLHCPEAYSRKYIEGDRRRDDTVANTLGSAVHMAARVDLEIKRDEGRLLPEQHLPDVAADAFERTWRLKDPRIDRSEGTKAEQRGVAKDHAIALTGLHRRRVTEVVDPHLLEVKVTADIPGYPNSLVGYIDLVERNYHLHDGKTTGAAIKADALATSTQGLVYPMLMELATGVRPPFFSLDIMKRPGKRARARYVQQSYEPNGDYSPILLRLERMAKIIEAGAFMPAAPGHWKCSSKYCVYFSDCPWGRARRVAVGMTL